MNNWSNYIYGIGTGSSARTIDLNKDGVLDIVLGAGGKENFDTDTAVIAINGLNGKLLWKVSGINQMVGSAGFLDINADEIADVFIGGRSAQLFAIDGSSGEIIWKFLEANAISENSGYFAFYNPQFISDQNNDGFKDILISNGGDNRVMAYNPNRPPGRLMIISSKDGKIIADTLVPDGKETYMSPVCLDDDLENPTIYFGTGGETIGGKFYRTTLKDVLEGNLNNATILAESQKKGFIAPPILININEDSVKDVVLNSVDGCLLAIDGKTDSTMWKVCIEGTEAYSTPSAGFYNEDKIPDFFCTFGIGTWPDIKRSVHFMVDGKTGKIEFKDYRGGFQYASPVTADLDGDGQDEVIVSINENEEYKGYAGKKYSYLLAYNFKDFSPILIGDTLPGINVASTPWIGDLDNSGYYNVIFNSIKFGKYNNDIDNPSGLYLSLIKTNFKVSTPLRWGAYMGTNHNGIF